MTSFCHCNFFRWIEFSKKSVAKRVANLLNGEQIGGKKRSPFYYDIWNIKYLKKFKWDDLVGEIAEKTHIREQKLNLEIAAAKKQRDHYLSNVEKSRTLKHIQERRKKVCTMSMPFFALMFIW
jgi:ESF2/ABP1 family protein